MKRQGCWLRQTSGGWVVELDEQHSLVLEADQTTAESLARDVLDLIQRATGNAASVRDNVVICPDSHATLFAQGELPANLKKGNRDLLKYQAESLLPWDAEEMAADFILTKHEIRVLAVDRKVWSPIVEALHRHGLHLRSLVPLPLLAIEEAMASLGSPQGVVLWEEPDHIDLWVFDRDGLARWNHLSKRVSERGLAIRLFAAQNKEYSTWHILNASDETLAILDSLPGIERHSHQTKSQVEWGRLAVQRLAGSTHETWFDLRDGDVAGSDRWRLLHGWMKGAAAALVTLLLSIPAGCWWQAHRAGRDLEQVRNAQVALYQAAFPKETRIPTDIPASVRRKVVQARALKNNDTLPDRPPSALDVLHATLAALPQDQDLLVRKIEINEGKLTIELELVHLEQVSPLVGRFREAGFKIDPFTPSQAAGKVLATLNGSWSERGIGEGG